MHYLNHTGQLRTFAVQYGVKESCFTPDGKITQQDKNFSSAIKMLQKKGYEVLMADSCRNQSYDIYIEFNIPGNKRLFTSLPEGFTYDKYSKNVRIERVIEERGDLLIRALILDIVVKDLIEWVNKLSSVNPRIKFHTH
jgi:hypothetical protein